MVRFKKDTIRERLRVIMLTVKEELAANLQEVEVVRRINSTGSDRLVIVQDPMLTTFFNHCHN